MKQLLLAVVLLVPLHAVFAQAEGDLASEGLRGRVSVVTEMQYYEGTKAPYMKTVDKYDTRGRLIEEIHNDYLLKLYFRKYFRYDTGSDGTVMKMNETDDSGRLVRSIEYKYDSQQHLVESADQRIFGDKKDIYRNEYYYDSSGKKAGERSYANEVLNYSTEYMYSGNGRLSGTRSYDKDGKVGMQYDYNYLAGAEWVHCEKQIGGVRTHIFRIIDSAGLVVEKTTYVGDYSKQTTESFTGFDSQGNWRKQSVKGTVIENYFVTREIVYYKE